METKKRIKILTALFFILFIIIIVRMVYLQVFMHKFFRARSVDQRKRIINLASNRGDIYDAQGSVLATTIDMYSVFTQKDGFAWVKRKVTQAEAEKIKKEKPTEYIIIKEKKRIYPKGRLSAQVIGFCGTDNNGLSGIELAWDRYLCGKSGQIITEGDPEGRELYGAVRVSSPGEDGQNITLSIDSNIQYIAEREIEAQIKKSSAISGTLIVMDAKNGEILALASKPDFNPNEYAKSSNKLWHPRFLDPYEPGSTFKVITTAAGIEEKVISPDSQLKALDKIEVGGKVIENSHKIKWGGLTISVSRMLEESINTATSQIGLKLGAEKFYNRIVKFGFGERTGFGMLSESSGIVRNWKNWYKSDLAMVTFGQAIAVTPMQLLSAVSAFANGGKVVRPCLIKKIESSDGKYIKVYSQTFRGEAISEKTADAMKQLLRNVVIKGSGKRAKMDWFTVGGKTGTAQKAASGGRGYMKGHYIASFIGLAPLNNPKIAALIIIDDPKGSIWGESVCGPVFKNVVEYSLRYLNTKPDVL